MPESNRTARREPRWEFNLHSIALRSDQNRLRSQNCAFSMEETEELPIDPIAFFRFFDSLVLVRTGAAIAEGASQPRRFVTGLKQIIVVAYFIGMR